MQIVAVDSGRQIARGGAVEGTAATARSEPLAPVTKVEAAASSTSRGGLKTFDAQLNRQVAGAQQALQFLTEADAKLRALRKEVSAGDASDAIEGFKQFWQQRAAASAGTLDGNLKFDSSSQARQEFAVRGLSFEALRRGDAETLSFAVGRWSGQPSSVTVDPRQSESSIMRSLDRALAPMGVRATRDAKGELAFSVPESAWAQMRDSLSIRGGGRRFPTGQFNQVRTVLPEQVVQPSQWSTADSAATRRTLQDIAQAFQFVRNSQGAVQAALDEAARNVEGESPNATQAVAAQWQDFASEYADILSRGDAEAIAATAPAVIGISKRTVGALLETAD